MSSSFSGNKCMDRVALGVSIGSAVGGAIGVVYGSYESFAYKIPGILKVRHIGKTTLNSAAVFGLFLGAGSFIQCGRN